MPAPPSNDNLRARADALPYWSRHAISSQLTELPGNPKTLFDEFRHELRDVAFLSPTAIDLLARSAWTQGHLHLHLHLHLLANRFLARDGQRRVVLRRELNPTLSAHGANEQEHPEAPQTPAQRIACWRWLSWELPADLLIAALFADSPDLPTTDRVSLSTPALRRLLHLGIAQTHAHLSACFTFPMGWLNLLLPRNETGNWRRSFPILNETPFGEQSPVLVAAASLVRILLGRVVMRCRATSATPPTLEELCDETAKDIPCSAAAQRVYSQVLKQACSFLLDPKEASKLSTQELSREEAAANLLLRRIQGASAFRTSTQLSLHHRQSLTRFRRWDDLVAADPLSRILPYSQALPETRLLSLFLQALHRERIDHKTSWSKLFWNYVRLRSQFFRYVTMRPGPPGFEWFRVYFERNKPFRPKFFIDVALQEEGGGDALLRSFEARIGPPENCTEVRNYGAELRQVMRVNAEKGIDEIGLVIHFPKTSEDDKERSERGPKRFRHWPWYFKQRKSLLAVKQALRYQPEILTWLRGVDFANIELARPTWIMLPLLEEARQISQEAAARADVPPMRVSCHCGEDFVRLADGLRRMHELLAFGGLRTGDRIGHGLALGWKADRWAQENPCRMQALDERLNDLLWELECYQLGDIVPPGGRTDIVRAECLRIGERIYTSSVRESDLLEARRRLHRPGMLLSHMRFANREEMDDEADRIVQRALWDRSVHRRGDEPISVVVTPGEVDFLDRAQGWLRSLMSHLEIVIESNPSSNHLIGSMAQLEDHPAFQLQPLRLPPATAEKPSVLLSINDDNPITFATTLADEYAYMHAGLLRAGVSSTDALEWLERARRAGWNSRFTVPWRDPAGSS